MVLVGLLVALEDGRPIIYRRRIVGKDGEFDAYKFRSMCKNADAVLAATPALKEEFERNFKPRHDPRVTRVGHVLREFSLDEPPQLFDVLNEQMNLSLKKTLSSCVQSSTIFRMRMQRCIFHGRFWPLLRSRRPELELETVGSRPPRSVRQLDGKDNIRVAASVPDVRPDLGRAWVALSPVRIRAGIQTKILEAMAWGVPVLAHRICCDGLKVKTGRDLLVADTPEEFVSAVELLLDNHALRANLIQAGRKYVEQQHNWEHSVEKLHGAYAEAIKDFTGSREALATAWPANEN